MDHSDLHVAILLAGLLIAVWIDQRHQRIPNWLCLSLAVAGTASQVASQGTTGAIMAISGAAVGLGIFLLPYLMRALAAGDVKLMTAVGAWLGPGLAAAAAALTLVAGVALAALVVTYRLSRASTTTDQLLTSRFPYAIAIATGAATTLILEATKWML